MFRIDEELIKRLYTILTVINSGYKLNSETYQSYADETYQLILAKYSWYYIPPTVHLMLRHAIAIQGELPFNLGEGSEECLESAHKRKRHVREFHARKNSRENNMIDIFHWELLVTDPLLLSKSLKEHFYPTQKPLTYTMRSLIKCEIT